MNTKLFYEQRPNAILAWLTIFSYGNIVEKDIATIMGRIFGCQIPWKSQHFLLPVPLEQKLLPEDIYTNPGKLPDKLCFHSKFYVPPLDCHVADMRTFT